MRLLSDTSIAPTSHRCFCPDLCMPGTTYLARARDFVFPAGFEEHLWAHRSPTVLFVKKVRLVIKHYTNFNYSISRDYHRHTHALPMPMDLFMHSLHDLLGWSEILCFRYRTENFKELRFLKKSIKNRVLILWPEVLGIREISICRIQNKWEKNPRDF